MQKIQPESGHSDKTKSYTNKFHKDTIKANYDMLICNEYVLNRYRRGLEEIPNRF